MNGYDNYAENQSVQFKYPSHWKMKRMRELFRFRKGLSITKANLESDGIAVISYGQVHSKKNSGVGLNDSLIRFVNESYLESSPASLVEQNDFIFADTSEDVAGCGNCAFIDWNTNIFAGYHSIIAHPIDARNSKYLAYLFKSSDWREQLWRKVNGVKVYSITQRMLKDTFVLIPPIDEQEQITRFLSWKISQINSLMGIKRKQIEALYERQSAYISEYVAHGITSEVPKRTSGIDWIGEIPAHWETIRCKYLFTERDERSAEGKEQHLSMSQKYGLVPDAQLGEKHTISASYKGSKLCYKDDLVLNRLKAHLGVFALSPQLGVISPDYTVLMPNTNRILPAFAETVLKSDRCRGELRIRVRGIVEGFWRLYTDDFNTIVLPVPPIEEQKEIMEHINAFKESTKKYEDILTQEITALQELKTRIISDAVTGKIDVRDIEIPDYEYVADETDADSDEEADMEETDEQEE